LIHFLTETLASLFKKEPERTVVASDGTGLEKTVKDAAEPVKRCPLGYVGQTCQRAAPSAGVAEKEE
jgi:hypothetical protein